MTRDPAIKSNTPTDTRQETSPRWQVLLKRHLEGLQYGVIQLTVHEGKVVQIDCTHRTRLGDSQSH